MPLRDQVRTQPGGAARGHERPGLQEGHDHREGHAQRHGKIEELPRAGHHGQGGQHQEGTKAGGQLRQRHFVAAEEGRVGHRGPQAQVPMGILQGNDRRIDQRSDGQGKAGEGHHVDRLAAVIKAHDRAHDRNRHGQHGDDRHPPLAQEDEDHQGTEDGPQHALLRQALDRMPHVDRLVHDHLQIDIGAAQAALDVGQGLLEGLDHGQRAGARLAEDGDIDLPPPVHADDVGLDETGVLRLGHVFEEDDVAVLGVQGNIAHPLDQFVHGIRIDGVIGSPSFASPVGRNRL